MILSVRRYDLGLSGGGGLLARADVSTGQKHVLVGNLNQVFHALGIKDLHDPSRIGFWAKHETVDQMMLKCNFRGIEIATARFAKTQSARIGLVSSPK